MRFFYKWRTRLRNLLRFKKQLDGDRAVVISGQNPKHGTPTGLGVSYADFIEYKTQNSSFIGIEASQRGNVFIRDRVGLPDRIRMSNITPGLFDLIKVPPLLGRNFQESDAQPNASPTLILDHTLWQNRYASDPNIIGKSILADGKPTTIIGVMPPDFKFPRDEEFWMPVVPRGDLEKNTTKDLRMYGTLSKGTSIKEAQIDMDPVAERLRTEFPEVYKNLGAAVTTFNDLYNAGPIKFVFMLMFAAVSCLLLIVCSNVSNLMLIRVIKRRFEISIQAAIGASRWHIIRQALLNAGLVARNMINIQQVNSFIPTESILTAGVNLHNQSDHTYSKPKNRFAYARTAIEGLKKLPGASHVAATSNLPGTSARGQKVETLDALSKDIESMPTARLVVQTPQFLDTIGLKIFERNNFTEADGLNGNSVAVVSRSFAEKHWPGESAIDKRIRFYQNENAGQWHRVIRVSENLTQDVRYPRSNEIASVTRNATALPCLSFMIRTQNDPQALVASLKTAMQEIDSSLPLYDIATLQDRLDESHRHTKIFGTIFLSFAIIALMMASTGLYAVIAQSTNSRIKEIGIRKALGASSLKIQGMMLTRGSMEVGSTNFMEQSSLLAADFKSLSIKPKQKPTLRVKRMPTQ